MEIKKSRSAAKKAEEGIAWLASRQRLKRGTYPKAMAKLCALLGNPQEKLAFVHIAGTNGKGSTAAFIASICTEAGYKTGLNISPFVVQFAERMQIDGKMISDSALSSVLAKVKKAADALEKAEGMHATEFECTTAAALLWFAEQHCDLVCMEAGIGGTGDATNLIRNTKVAVLTKIALDHTALIGNTPAEIAKNKCGILKPGCVAVSAPEQLPEVKNIIEAACAEQQIALRCPEPEDITLRWQIAGENRIDYGGYTVGLQMPGAHQAQNAAVAVEAALALCDAGYEISDEAILAGLEKVKLPARIEIVRRNPLLIIDGAHNPDGIATLAATLKAMKLPELTGIIGMMRDKDVSALAALSDCFELVYTVPSEEGERAMPPEELAEKCRRYFRHVEPRATLAEALHDAEQQENGVCICGSLYLAGQAEKMI